MGCMQRWRRAQRPLLGCSSSLQLRQLAPAPGLQSTLWSRGTYWSWEKKYPTPWESGYNKCCYSPIDETPAWFATGVIIRFWVRSKNMTFFSFLNVEYLAYGEENKGMTHCDSSLCIGRVITYHSEYSTQIVGNESVSRPLCEQAHEGDNEYTMAHACCP